MQDTTQGLPIGAATAKINKWLPGHRHYTRDMTRDAVTRGEIEATHTAGGHIRISDESLRRYMLQLVAPQVSAEDWLAFTGPCDGEDALAMRFHQANAERVLMPSRVAMLRAECQAILDGLRQRARDAESDGRYELGESLRKRARALEDSSYYDMGGVVKVIAPPGGIAPGSPTEFALDDDDV